jgi:hypothetical protein
MVQHNKVLPHKLHFILIYVIYYIICNRKSIGLV